MKLTALAATTAMTFLLSLTISTSSFALHPDARSDEAAAHLLTQCALADDADFDTPSDQPQGPGWSGCCSASLGYCIECPPTTASRCVKLPYARLQTPDSAGTSPGGQLALDDVRRLLDQRLARPGNERLKVGAVEEIDDRTISADITTEDDRLTERFTSLVTRFTVDRYTGMMRPMAETTNNKSSD